ncbi:uncharacterized protein LY89DRAFT_776420 [Mollisia scopiformis]|uniref:Uncharacterized protein n=1 Tax=Mollisia scopiformis TaxID=149040 RepID=A0A194XW85_MOLSC|nr:uncharacterized protein LY89DRAFT_776420 [Mollisia scopiformis]KUJ24279.1 hypothetical protein LY89DRAFT_776420 [Mollisia scopiformis]
MASRLAILLGASTVLALASQSPIIESQNGPNEESARQRAPQIFNALHSSVRQWGSSLYHNGMSFLPATIPANTDFYHGNPDNKPVTGMEWLAFEIEHAEGFARGRFGRGPGGGPHGPGGPPPKDEEPLSELRRRDEVTEATTPALHHYRTAHDMRVLYLDGMSAGKTTMGTLDQQEFVLCDGDRTGPGGGPPDAKFAADMCRDFGHVIEGVVRMEAGFEVIACNFSTSLHFISATARPPSDVPEYNHNQLREFEFVRGIGQRYHGIAAGRVQVDYSNIVSAFFYDMNLTNPDPAHASLPRFSSSDPKILKDIKSAVLSVLSNPSSTPSIDWQGVVDLIVTRYSDRLQFMALPSTTHSILLSELNFLLNLFIDYPITDSTIPTAISRCTTSYISGLSLSTHTDHLLYTAVSTVKSTICHTLFSIRSSLLDSNTFNTLKSAKDQINSLTKYLGWTTWLECGKCAYDEVCMVAMWPLGGVKEHEHPSCVSREDVSSKTGYWEGGPGGGRPGSRRPGEGRDER